MKQFRYLLPLLIIILSASCSMKQEVLLEKNGSGRLSFDMELAPYLGEVIQQVQALMGEEIPEGENGFFDLEAIRKDFAENPDVTLLSLESPDDLSLKGEFDFVRIETMLQKMEEGSAGERIVSFSRSGGVSEVDLNITRESVRALLAENDSFNNPLVENFGPGATEGLSSNDYLDMMEFAMGSESRQGILDSRLSILINVDGTVLEQKGGRKIGDHTVRFDLPLLDLLMLEKPLRYSFSFK